MEKRDEHALSVFFSSFPKYRANMSEISPHGQSKEQKKFQYLLLGPLLNGSLMEAFNLWDFQFGTFQVKFSLLA